MWIDRRGATVIRDKFELVSQLEGAGLCAFGFAAAGHAVFYRNIWVVEK